MHQHPFKNISYLDFHTHRIRRQNDTEILEIVSIHLGKETEYDWYTVGKHPWWTEEVLSEEEKSQFLAHLSNKRCLAIGEMGLDKLKGPELTKQLQILKSQLKIANELEKPVIIHCVRAFDSLIKVKKEFSDIPNWCVHGFSRHAELAKQLINQGFYLSIMPVFEVTEKYQTLIKSLPKNRFFLETDSMPNFKIEDIYLQASNILNVSQETLQQQILQNAKTFFGYE